MGDIDILLAKAKKKEGYVIMFNKGDRVNHINGHGLGTIIMVRKVMAPYLATRDIGALTSLIHLDQLLAVNAFYGGDRYPYQVQFDSGYSDVYAESDLTLA